MQESPFHEHVIQRGITKTFMTTILGIVPILTIILGMIFFIAFTGCDETGKMVGPVIGGPADTEPTTPAETTMGEVKQPGEPTTEPNTPAEELTPPADTTPPTVTEVAWYHDQEMTEEITDDVRPGSTIYTVVVFSEAMEHVVADDETARPALSIVIGGLAIRLSVLPRDANGIKSGEVRPINGGTDNYLCKFTVPADTIGTIALRVETESADAAGNTVTEVSEHSTPFRIAEPESTITLPPGYELPPELIPTEPTVLSANEQAMLDNLALFGLDATAVQPRTTKSVADTISVIPMKDREEVYELFVASIDNLPFFKEAAEKMKEVNIRLGILNAQATITGSWEEYNNYREDANWERGIPWGSEQLERIYFEENAGEKEYTGVSRYWMILEWYRLSLEHPDLHTFRDVGRPWELLNHYRDSCKKGWVFGLDNPWN